MGFIADKLLLYLGGSGFMARVDEKTLTKAMGFKGVFSMGGRHYILRLGHSGKGFEEDARTFFLNKQWLFRSK